MKKIQGLVLVLTLGVASLAHAQATRTWVSGVGDDVNPCSRTAPCKTFAGAISKTATNGMINVLDPGGFGGVTITKSITIDGTPFMAGVLASGTNGILVNGSGAVVTLRGLDIEGVAAATNGIRVILAGTVNVENCEIFGYARGMSLEGTTAMNVNIINTTVRNNTQGIFSAPTLGSTKVNMENVRSVSNTGNGFISGVNTDAYITRSNLSNNGGTGVRIEQATFVSVESSTMSNNARGIECGVAGAATCVLSRTIITKNTVFGTTRAGDGSGATGVLTGFSNNVIVNNAANNTVSGSSLQQ
jgi:hypothetical protein